jgi:hypothetical protein
MKVKVNECGVEKKGKQVLKIAGAAGKAPGWPWVEAEGKTGRNKPRCAAAADGWQRMSQENYPSSSGKPNVVSTIFTC